MLQITSNLIEFQTSLKLIFSHHALVLITELQFSNFSSQLLNILNPLSNRLITLFNCLSEMFNLFHKFDSVRSEIFTNHCILLCNQLPFLLNDVQFLFQFIDVLSLRDFHLLHYFLLSVQFTVQVLRLRQWLIHLMLEFDALLLQELNLPIWSIQLDFCWLHIQNLIFQVGLRCKQFLLGLWVVLLFFFETFNPHVTRVFFLFDNIVQCIYLISWLFLMKLELTLDRLFLDF